MFPAAAPDQFSLSFLGGSELLRDVKEAARCLRGPERKTELSSSLL